MFFFFRRSNWNLFKFGCLGFCDLQLGHDHRRKLSPNILLVPKMEESSPIQAVLVRLM